MGVISGQKGTLHVGRSAANATELLEVLNLKLPRGDSATVVLDTNVILQSLFSSSHSASHQTLNAYFAGRFRPQFSEATLDELLGVLTLPRIREKHGQSEESILELITSLLANGDCLAVAADVSASLCHDVTDTKFIALALHANANFLVTNDRRHLLHLGSFGQTKIVTPAQFVRLLP